MVVCYTIKEKKMADTSDNLPDFFRGDTYSITLNFTDPTSGQAIDITGYVFTITLKVNEADADPGALQKQVTASGPAALAGKVEVRLESDETGIAVGPYFMDLQRTIPGSPPDVLTIKKQVINVLQDISITT